MNLYGIVRLAVLTVFMGVSALTAQTRQAIFAEMFEGAATGWTLSGSGWEFGIPTYSSGPTSAFQGSKCAGTILNGVYINNANYTMYSPLISLPNSTDLTFSFYEWYYLESSYDYIKVVISVDSGRTWNTLLNSRSGMQSSWRRQSFNLSSYKGMNVKVGFTLTSDGSNTYAGYYVDSLAVTTSVDLSKKITLKPIVSPIYNRKPVFSWTSHDSIETYKISASFSPSFENPIFALPLVDTFYQPAINFPYDTIYWRVQSATDSRFWSEVLNFIVLDSLQSVITISPTSMKMTQGDTGSLPVTICNATGRKELTYSFKGAGSDTTSALIWSYVTYTGSSLYLNMKSAIRQYNSKIVFEDYTYSDSSTLRSRLEGKDVFILPRPDYSSASSTQGVAFRNILNDFINNGGKVVCLYPSSYSSFLLSANLISITGSSSTSSSGYSITIKNLDHPLLAGVTSMNTRSYTSLFNVSTTDTQNIIATYSSYGVLYQRDQGEGKFIAIGHDFNAYDSSWAKIISNAVKSDRASKPAWLTFSSDSGQVAIGACGTVRFRFNADGLRDGTYKGLVSLHHNSPLSASPIMIPCTLVVPKPTMTYGLSVTNDTLNNGDSATHTLALSNTGLSQLFYNVSSAAKSSILINEVVYNQNYIDEAIELINRGGDQSMNGWRLSWKDWNGNGQTYIFPSSFIFKGGKTLILASDYSYGTNSDTILYTNMYMNWSSGTQVSISLFDNNLKAVDFVYTSSMSDTVPSTTTWKGSGVYCSSCYGFERNKNTDNDTASDWTAQPSYSVSTMGSLNNGQTNTPVAVGKWLYVNNGVGTVAKGGNAAINVKYDATAMTYSGTYIDSIILNHNATNKINPLVIRCTLKVMSNIPALIPVTPNPTSEKRPTFNWNSVTAATGYTIQVATTADFSSPFLVQPITDTIFKPSVNLPLGTIYWKVKSDLNALYSMPSTFILQSDSIPTIITFVPETTFVRRPTLRWARAVGASAYQIQIDTAGTFSSPWLSVPVSDTFYTPSVNLPFSRIHWRVRNMDYSVVVFSAIDTFFVGAQVSSEMALVELPERFGLNDATPNPFNPTTKINFAIPQLSGQTEINVKVLIYDMKGKVVKQLVNSKMNSGYHSVEFNGRGANGNSLPSGMYLCRMNAGTFTKTVKILLMK